MRCGVWDFQSLPSQAPLPDARFMAVPRVQAVPPNRVKNQARFRDVTLGVCGVPRTRATTGAGENTEFLHVPLFDSIVSTTPWGGNRKRQKRRKVFQAFPRSSPPYDTGRELEKGSSYQRSYRMDLPHVVTMLDRQGGVEESIPKRNVVGTGQMCIVRG
jgi:hypothetical protein